MNNFFTRLKSCITVHLYSVLSIVLQCCVRTSTQRSIGKSFGNFLQSASLVALLIFSFGEKAFAQLPPACPKSGIYIYDPTLGSTTLLTPFGTAKTFFGGILNGKTLAEALNGANGAKFLSIDDAGMNFLLPDGKIERYSYAVPSIVPAATTNVPLTPTIPLPILPDLLGIFPAVYDLQSLLYIPGITTGNIPKGLGFTSKMLPQKGNLATISVSIPPVLMTSPHSGEIIDRSNPKFIDVDGTLPQLPNPSSSYPLRPIGGGPLALMEDAPGQITSYYSYLSGGLNTGLLVNSDMVNTLGEVLAGAGFATLGSPTFSGGPLDGQLINKANIKVGAENGGLFVLDESTADGDIYSYTAGGTFPVNQSFFYSTFSGGPLDGKTPKQIFSGAGIIKAVPGTSLTYLGVDGLIARFVFYDAGTNRLVTYNALTGGLELLQPPATSLTGIPSIPLGVTAGTGSDHNGALNQVLGPDFIGVANGMLMFKDKLSWEGYDIFTGLQAPLLMQGPCIPRWDGGAADNMIMGKCIAPAAGTNNPAIFLGTEQGNTVIVNAFPPSPIPVPTHHTMYNVFLTPNGTISEYDQYGKASFK